MTSAPAPAVPDRLPLLHIAALSGLVAAASAVLAFAAVEAAAGDPGATGILWLFVPASVVAVAVAIVAGAPLHVVMQLCGMTSRWFYVAGALIIIGGFHLWLFWLSRSRVDATALETALLVPVAAVPSGLLFHDLAQRARSVPPLHLGDALIVAAWIAAWVYFAAHLRFHTPVDSLDPWMPRDHILGLVLFAGLPVFMLLGIAAGLARLWSLRLGVVIAAASWLVPAAFAIDFFATPLGPKTIHLMLGDRAFDLDWHLRPRQQGSGLCFDATGRGPHASPRHYTLNPEICLTDVAGPLAATENAAGAGVGDEHRWGEAGLICDDQQINRRAGRECSAGDEAGRTVTLIECTPGSCFHRFDRDGLRYAMYWNPQDFAAWREMQELAVRLVSEVNEAARP